MHFDFARQFQLGQAPQILAQDLFDPKLMLIARMLIMASPAACEIRTGGRDAMRRRFDDLVHPGSCEAGLLLDKSRVDSFFREDKRHEHSLAASMLVGGQTRQSVATVN